MLNRNNKVVSHGIPGAALLHMARSVCDETGTGTKPYRPIPGVICRGILPGLCDVVEEHRGEITCAKGNRRLAGDAMGCQGDLLSIMETSDADQNLLTAGINPYGNSDYRAANP